MKIIDLTHTISPIMPVFPGTETPVISRECTIEENGFLEHKLTMFSHTGTHIDAPAHIISSAATLDKMGPDRFYGKAAVFSFSEPDRGHLTGGNIDIADLEPHRRTLEQIDFLLLNTGWGKYWGTDAYFSGYPTLAREAAEWLSGFSLKGIGVDTISLDPFDSTEFLLHNRVLSAGMIVIENLTNLDSIPDSPFVFSCLPLKFGGADGSPVRAVGIIQ